MSELPDEAHLVALVTLPKMGPVRLAEQLDGRSARDAWMRIIRGGGVRPRGAKGAEIVEGWRSAATALDVAELWERHRGAGVGVLGVRAAGFPDWLAADPEPPAVLFTDGDPAVLTGRRVAIVGTRQCTRYGIDLAYELGSALSASGVAVVSGLARGIDAAAHRGALDAGVAPPIAVVGTGLDIKYPAENQHLWADIARHGVVVSEAPLGTKPERWRFPARNRIIAAAAEIVIVIESHERGGSLYTASQAMERGRPVFAVPGPIRSAASKGCNMLLADGCLPLCDVADALVAVGFCAEDIAPAPEVDVTPEQCAVLDRLGWVPSTLQELAGPEPLAALAAVLEELVGIGVVARRGPWFERTGVLARSAGPNDPRMVTWRGGLPQ